MFPRFRSWSIHNKKNKWKKVREGILSSWTACWKISQQICLKICFAQWSKNGNNFNAIQVLTPNTTSVSPQVLLNLCQWNLAYSKAIKMDWTTSTRRNLSWLGFTELIKSISLFPWVSKEISLLLNRVSQTQKNNKIYLLWRIKGGIIFLLTSALKDGMKPFFNIFWRRNFIEITISLMLELIRWNQLYQNWKNYLQKLKFSFLLKMAFCIFSIFSPSTLDRIFE